MKFEEQDENKKKKFKKDTYNGDNNFECVRFDEKTKFKKIEEVSLQKNLLPCPIPKANFWPFVFIKHVDEVHLYRVCPPPCKYAPIQGDN